MTSLRAFTIVEAVVVTAVIAILATIVGLSFNGYKERAADSQRAASASVIANKLEKYYNLYGEYPGCVALTSSATSVSTDTLVGIDKKVLVTPNAEKNATDNSIACEDLAPESKEDIFAYVADSSSVCRTGLACTAWELKFRKDSTNEIISIPSNHGDHNSASEVIAIAAPTGLNVTANMNGAAAHGETNGGMCEPGATIERQMQSASSITTEAGSWSAWNSTSQLNVPATQGWLYVFRAQARCDLGGQTSDWAQAQASIARPIDTPLAPTVSVVGSPINAVWNWNTTTCPAGTVAQYQGQSVGDWGYSSAVYGPYVNYTTRTWVDNGEGYSYTVSMQTRCTSPYINSDWSVFQSAEYIRPMTTPGGATDFTLTVAPDRLSYVHAWTWPTCGPGVLQYSHMNPYMDANGNGWAWTNTGTDGWAYGFDGWNETGYWSPKMNSNSSSAVEYPINPKMKVMIKVQYICVNSVTLRTSAWGPVATSPLFDL